MTCFTRQERFVLIFIIGGLLLGGAITWYKRRHPEFAPELYPLTPAHSTVVDATPSPTALEQGPEADSARLAHRLTQIQRREPIPGRQDDLSGIININTASQDSLQLLPGVGPRIAERIIAYRQQHGPFATPAEIQQVKGIGAATYQRMRPFISVD